MALALKVAAALAALGLAWQAGQLVWLAIRPAPATAELAPLVLSPRTASMKAAHIADAHLFGRAQDAATVDPGNLPTSQSSLVVTGTIALKNPQAGFALIGENAGAASLHRAGANIGKVARLHSVYRDRVVIDRNGALETLLLPRSLLAASVLTPQQSVRANESITQSAQVVSAKLDEVKRITANPNVLGAVLRSQPVFTNGSLKGYRVYPGANHDAFASAGLQSGDLVTAVNGTAVSGGNDVFSQLGSSGVANVTVNRSGQQLQLTLNMAQLARTE